MGIVSDSMKVNGTEDPAWVRLSVNLAPDVAESLRRLAKGNQITATEAIRRAIGIYQFIDGEVTQGHKILVSSGKDEPVREVVLL